jgi:hypothetical protein
MLCEINKDNCRKVITRMATQSLSLNVFQFMIFSTPYTLRNQEKNTDTWVQYYHTSFKSQRNFKIKILFMKRTYRPKTLARNILQC